MEELVEAEDIDVMDLVKDARIDFDIWYKSVYHSCDAAITL